MRLSFNALASSCLQVAGWAVLLLVAGLFVQTVVPAAMAQPAWGRCPRSDGPIVNNAQTYVYPCNQNCMNANQVNTQCNFSCNNGLMPACVDCLCGRVQNTTKCGCS